MACVRLGEVLANAIGNTTAGRAWFAPRAGRLVEDEPPCIEQGWVAVAAMGCDVDDPAELLADAELALDRARRFGDVNLETKALADAGLAHVQAGRIARGHAPARRGDGAGVRPRRRRRGRRQVGVLVLHRLLRVVRLRAGPDVDRPAHPARAADVDVGPRRRSCPSHCDSVRAALLVEMGRLE